MKTFANIESFLVHIAKISAKSQQIQTRAMRDAAEVLQTEAKSSLGHYKSAAGPFNAWADLSERTQTEREKMGYTSNDPLLRSGELRDHIDISFDSQNAVVGVPSEIVGSGSKADPTRDIGDIAADMEFGTNGKFPIPSRPFLGRSGFVKGHQAAAAAAEVITDALAGRAYRAPKAATSSDPPF